MVDRRSRIFSFFKRKNDSSRLSFRSWAGTTSLGNGTPTADDLLGSSSMSDTLLTEVDKDYSGSPWCRNGDPCTSVFSPESNSRLPRK